MKGVIPQNTGGGADLAAIRLTPTHAHGCYVPDSTPPRLPLEQRVDVAAIEELWEAGERCRAAYYGVGIKRDRSGRWSA